MYQFCWLWESNCRFVLDAGWIQALATAVALWLTHSIATRNERKRRNEVLHAANMYITQLLACIADMREACQINSRSAMDKQRYILAETMILGRSVSAELLPSAISERVFKARGIAAETEALSENIRYFDPERPITEFRDKFDGLRERLHITSIEIAYELNPHWKDHETRAVKD